MANMAIGIDIGLNSLKIVEVERKNDKYFLKNAVIKYFNEDASVGATAVSSSEIIKEIRNIQKKYKIAKNRKTAVSLPTASVFIRYVSVLNTKRRKEKDIFAYEAKEQIPVPLNEVVWDYTVIKENKKEKDGVLIAVKKEVVDESINIISAAGFKADTVSLDLLNLSNIVRNSGKYRHASGFIIIDVGYDSSGIIICKGDNIWLRNFRLGGKSFSEGIMEYCGIDFKTAEKIKIEGPSFLEKENPELIDKAKEAVNFNLESFYEEVERSVSFYKMDRLNESEYEQFKTFKIIFSGGGSKLQGLTDYFEKRIDMEVETLDIVDTLRITNCALNRNQFDNIAFDADIKNEIIPLLSVAIGAAVGELSKNKIKINFLQDKEEQKDSINYTKILNFLSYIFFFGGFLIFLFFQSQILNIKKNNLNNLEELADNVDRIAPKLDIVHKERDEFLQDGLFYYNFLNKRFLWLDLLNEIAGALSDGVWLTDIQANGTYSERQDNDIILQGKAASYDEFDEFISKLKKIDVVSGVKPESITGKKKPFNFLLNMSIKNKHISGDK